MEGPPERALIARRAACRLAWRATLAGLAAGASSAMAPAAGAAEAPAEWALSPFSRFPAGGPLPPAWREQRLRNVAPNRFGLVADAGATVLQVDAQASASSLVHAVPSVARHATRLRWRWKVDRFPLGDGFGEKRGDDFAGRVYVMFDYPMERVPLAQRWMIRLARAVYGDAVPAAALCYVVDPRAAAGTWIDSPYTPRVKVVVVRATSETGRWWSEERDLAADFARAFGAEHGPGRPPIAAIALAADADQSGATLRTWFGDVQLAAT